MYVVHEQFSSRKLKDNKIPAFRRSTVTLVYTLFVRTDFSEFVKQDCSVPKVLHFSRSCGIYFKVSWYYYHWT